MPAQQQQRTLCALVQQFNLAPAAYVDPSWLPPEWLPQFERWGGVGGAMHPRTANALSHWLLRQHALAQAFDFDFSAADKRLALLDAAAFRKLARYLGLAIYARCLRGVVERSARGTLVQRIGADAYDFVLRKAPAVNLGGSAQRVDPASADLEAQLIATGGARLLAALPCGAPAVRSRAQLKLPRPARFGTADGSAVAAASESEAAATRRVLISHFIPELVPQWAWLF
jgi:hypothetical protein